MLAFTFFALRCGLKIDLCNPFQLLLLLLSMSASDSESSSDKRMSMPRGGMLLRMHADGTSTVLDDQAPGYRVDMAAAAPLLQSIGMLLARKALEEEEEENEKQDTGMREEGSKATGSSTAMGSTEAQGSCNSQEKDIKNENGDAKSKKHGRKGKKTKKSRFGKKKY